MSFRTARLSIWFAATLCILATSATAQGPQLPQLFGVFQPKLGVWSEYQVADAATAKTSKMRMAIVGEEQGAFWYEVAHEEGGNRNIIKMLVRGNPNEPDNIKRLIIKSGDGPAQEMPSDFVAMGRKMAVHMFEKRSGVPNSGDGQVRVEDVGKRQLTVPAGTLETTLHRIINQDGRQLAEYNSNPAVLPFGVVRSVTESSTMELLGYGDGAQSRITEEPKVMMAPPGMPGGMPRGMPPGMMQQGQTQKRP